jgi:hypothetical protein
VDCTRSTTGERAGGADQYIEQTLVTYALALLHVMLPASSQVSRLTLSFVVAAPVARRVHFPRCLDMGPYLYDNGGRVR